MRLTELTRYADALRCCTSERLWELFDGTRAALNITHECVDRHARDEARIAVRIAHADGWDETVTFAELSAAAARFAHFIKARGIKAGERVAIALYTVNRLASRYSPPSPRAQTT